MEFQRAARSYITFLFNSFQGLKGLTNDLVKGLGCFDLGTLLIGPVAHAPYCQSQLFTTFRLRGYFIIDQETTCGEEYFSFLDDFRRNYPDLEQPTMLISDTVKFLVDMPSLHSRPLLHKLFRLACSCLDEPFLVLPSVKFGSVDSDNPTNSLIDVILPVQAYFSNVSYGIEAVTTDQSVSAFLRLEPDFSGVGLSDTYCLWDSVDSFGCSKILGRLNSRGSRPQVATGVIFFKDAGGSKLRGTSKSPAMKDCKKPSQLLSDKELTSTAKGLLTPSSSKL